MHETPDLVFAKDRQGRYTFVNPAAARFSGRTPEDIVGKTDQELFPDSSFTHSDRRVLDSDAPWCRRIICWSTGSAASSSPPKFLTAMTRAGPWACWALRATSPSCARPSPSCKSYDVLRQAEQLARLGSWTWELDTEHFQASEMMYVMNGLDPRVRR